MVTALTYVYSVTLLKIAHMTHIVDLLVYILYVHLLYLQPSVSCPSHTDPNNGVMTCLLGDDAIPSYEDTCNFTCNTGYVLVGSDTRICQKDGGWSGTDPICLRG